MQHAALSAYWLCLYRKRRACQAQYNADTCAVAKLPKLPTQPHSAQAPATVMDAAAALRGPALLEAYQLPAKVVCPLRWSRWAMCEPRASVTHAHQAVICGGLAAPAVLKPLTHLEQTWMSGLCHVRRQLRTAEHSQCHECWEAWWCVTRVTPRWRIQHSRRTDMSCSTCMLIATRHPDNPPGPPRQPSGGLGPLHDVLVPGQSAPPPPAPHVR